MFIVGGGIREDTHEKKFFLVVEPKRRRKVFRVGGGIREDTHEKKFFLVVEPLMSGYPPPHRAYWFKTTFLIFFRMEMV